ncbi:MAG: CobW family GTP-binding protein [Acidobacteriota bacterium]
MEPKTPIMLITGSLGSGKTTLLKRILESTGRRIAVLMNEFGEIAIDSKIISGENVEIVELAGGCVCCSMTGELEAAVREIIEKVKPEIIVVEATGVAESDALVFEVEESLPEVRLDSVVCIVDAYLSVKHPQVGYTARTQLTASDIILLNKIDLVSSEEVKEVEGQIRRFNDTALVFRTVGCDVDIGLLFGLDVEKRPKVLIRHGNIEFESFVYATEAVLDKDRFDGVVASLPDSVFRAKGFVRLRSGGSILLNYVLGRAEFEDFPADVTQLVFIGPKLGEEKESILKRLKECEA